MCGQEEKAPEETADATPAAEATVPEEEAATEKATAADSEVTTATETGTDPAATLPCQSATHALALCTCMCVSEHKVRKSAWRVWESSSAVRRRTCVCGHSNARLTLSMLRLDAAPLHPGSRAQRAGV